MHKNIFKLENIISYFGILPFFFIVIDLRLFGLITLNFIIDFSIFYSLIIFSFIGAMRWKFFYIQEKIIILYGFAPSIFSTILIILNLLEFDKRIILIMIIFLLTLQFFIDYIICKFHKIENLFFNYIRVPCTLCIVFSIIYIILV
jgi:hypothetical protein